MNGLGFDWDEKKNRANKKKHDLDFDEAKSVFWDENAARFPDPDHSTDEDRFLMVGMSFKLRVLVVCHCFRESNDVIRIISARKANKKEQSSYWS